MVSEIPPSGGRTPTSLPILLACSQPTVRDTVAGCATVRGGFTPPDSTYRWRHACRPLIPPTPSPPHPPPLSLWQPDPLGVTVSCGSPLSTRNPTGGADGPLRTPRRRRQVATRPRDGDGSVPPDTSRLSIVSDSDQFARRSDLIASLTRDRPGRTRRRRGRSPGCNP